jgi:hypothetical protein
LSFQSTAEYPTGYHARGNDEKCQWKNSTNSAHVEMLKVDSAGFNEFACEETRDDESRNYKENVNPKKAIVQESYVVKDNEHHGNGP